jgi:hypothetical protein
MSSANSGVGSMKIGGLARRKMAKQVTKSNSEYKMLNYRDPDSPRISINPKNIINDANIIINSDQNKD